LYQRALAIREKALGPDHPENAFALNGLAAAYLEKKDYARAEPLYQRALAIREKALGRGHPHVAESLNGLAVLYLIKRNHERAEPLLKRAIAIQEKALGPDDPEVARSLTLLALLYRAKEHYARAEILYSRALAIYVKTLGHGHPDTSATFEGLLATQRMQRDLTFGQGFDRQNFEVPPGSHACACSQAGGPREPGGAWLAIALAAAAFGRRRASGALTSRRRRGPVTPASPHRARAGATFCGIPQRLVGPRAPRRRLRAEYRKIQLDPARHAPCSRASATRRRR
jgi:MYXO-CTERM domain-containing protein